MKKFIVLIGVLILLLVLLYSNCDLFSDLSFDEWTAKHSTITSTSIANGTTTSVGGTTTTTTTINDKELIYIPGGTFTQRDTNGNNFFHTVDSFLIGKYFSESLI